MRPVNATLARQIQAGVAMDTQDMSFDPSEMRRRYPSMSYTSLADVIRRDYGKGVSEHSLIHHHGELIGAA